MIDFEKIDFIITKDQVEQIRPYMEDIDKIVKLGYYKFMSELDDAIIMELGYNYEDTDASEELQRLYNQIHKQNN